MSRANIIFSTNAIDAIGNKPSIPPQIITAKPRVNPPTKDDWWTFDLLRDGVPNEIQVAIAKGLDVQKIMREEAEYLLTVYRDEE